MCSVGKHLVEQAVLAMHGMRLWKHLRMADAGLELRQ